MVYESYNAVGDVLLSTDDPLIAAELNFRKNGDGEFLAWVPNSEVAEFFRETWLGEIDGRKVVIECERNDEYSINTQSSVVGIRWGLRQVDKMDWAGRVPKTACTNVTCQRKNIIPPFRRQG